MAKNVVIDAVPARAQLPKKLTLAQLGFILEVEIEGWCFGWKKGACELLWHEERKALVFFDAPAKAAPTQAKRGDTKAIKAFERFNDRDAQKIVTDRYNIKGPWLDLGYAARVDYWSDKWGDKSGYTHDLGRQVKLYRQGPDRGPHLFCLRGGRLRCTPRGLEG